MPISSYVLRCAPADRARVLNALEAMPGAEVGEITADGLAVVIDSTTTREAEDMGGQLQSLPGVQAAVLVYHNFEDVHECQST